MGCSLNSDGLSAGALSCLPSFPNWAASSTPQQSAHASRMQPMSGRDPKRIMFVANIGVTLDNFVAPLSIHLMERGFETIGCCGGEYAASSFSRIYMLPPFRREGPVAVWRAQRSLRAIVRAEQPDLLHLHSPPALVLGRLTARTCGVPALAIVHGTFLEPLTWRSVVWATVEGALASLATHTVVENEDDRRFYARFVPARRLSQAPVGGIGLDVDRLERARIAPTRVAAFPSVVVLGRLTPDKNLDRIVEAFQRVREYLPTATLTFVGSTLDGEPPWLVPRQPGVAHLPWVEHPYGILAGSDVLVSASRREGFPMGIAEGIALGVPVVAVANRGTRQLVRSGAEGLVLVEDDTQELAAAITATIHQATRSKGSTLMQRWSRASAIDFHTSLIEQIVTTSSRQVTLP